MEYKKQIILKDGRICILRNGTEQDGPEALNCFNLAHAETDFLQKVGNRYEHAGQADISHLRYVMICGCGFSNSTAGRKAVCRDRRG